MPAHAHADATPEGAESLIQPKASPVISSDLHAGQHSLSDNLSKLCQLYAGFQVPRAVPLHTASFNIACAGLTRRVVSVVRLRCLSACTPARCYGTCIWGRQDVHRGAAVVSVSQIGGPPDPHAYLQASSARRPRSLMVHLSPGDHHGTPVETLG